ncbi:unnamed protein product [Agarophyton chilense]
MVRETVEEGLQQLIPIGFGKRNKEDRPAVYTATATLPPLQKFSMGCPDVAPDHEPEWILEPHEGRQQSAPMVPARPVNSRRDDPNGDSDDSSSDDVGRGRRKKGGRADSNSDSDRHRRARKSRRRRQKRRSSGLKNAPVTFQRALDIILSRVKWQYALVYLDDVIIYSHTVSEHFDHVRTILSSLRSAGITLRLDKCQFFSGTVDYLGHVIRPGKLQVSTRTRDAIRAAKSPTNQTELRSFLGLCNVFRRFVKSFARIAAPLNSKLEKNKPFNFETLTDTEHEAFEKLRQRLIRPPILAISRQDMPYVLDTDACDIQVGCVLLQKQPDGDLLPIGDWSRSLNKAERSYSTTERECLAVVWAILHLRPYLEGARFTLRTNHHALRWILNLADASGRLARWRLRLMEYDFDMTDGEDTTPLDEEVPCLLLADRAEENDDLVADITVDGEVKTDAVLDWHDGQNPIGCPEVMAIVEEETNVRPVTLEELIQEQAEDEYCKSVRKDVGNGITLFDINRYGVLIRHSPLDGALQKVVPRSLVPCVLYLSHYPRLEGHPGGTRMYNTLRRDFYWPQMANDVYQTARDCRSCAAMRRTQNRSQKRLKLFPAAKPLEFVAMDIVGPFPKSVTGHEYILVITDRFTKLCREVPLRPTTAPVVARTFLENWAYPYGIPNYLLTDNGPQFVSKFFEEICRALGTKHVTTTAYHPQANGQAERFNKTLVQRLRHYVADHQSNWHAYVQPLTYGYNLQVHRSTGTTPFDLALTRVPPNVVLDEPSSATDPATPTQPTPGQMKRYTLRLLKATLQSARNRLTNAQQRYKADFDKSVRATPTFAADEEVFLDLPTTTPTGGVLEEQERTSRKLLPKTTGPYKVISATDSTVTINVDGIHDTVSIDRVTRAPARIQPVPVTTERARTVTFDPDGPFAEEPVTDTTSPPAGNNHRAELSQPDSANSNSTQPDSIGIVERILDHGLADDPPHGLVYRVRWYGCSAAEDSWEPPKNLPQHFISRYWKRKSRTA